MWKIGSITVLPDGPICLTTTQLPNPLIQRFHLTQCKSHTKIYRKTSGIENYLVHIHFNVFALL